MFKGLGSLGNMASMVGALQHLPDKMKELSSRMADERVTAQSDCGKVVVTMSGNGVVQGCKIDPDLSGDALEAAVVSAHNNAGAAAKELFAQSVSQMADEMDLKVPGIENMIASMTGR